MRKVECHCWGQEFDVLHTVLAVSDFRRDDVISYAVSGCDEVEF